MSTQELSNKDYYQQIEATNYLQDYYAVLGKENTALLEFFSRAFTGLDGGDMLEVGGGPTVYQLITASQYVSSIIFTDYIEDYLNQVRIWTSGAPNAFDWDDYFSKALEFELGHVPVNGEIENRKRMLKNKLIEIKHCDVSRPNPIDPDKRKFDVVGMHFVLDGISRNKEEWKEMLTNVSSTIVPGGTLIMSNIVDVKYWKVGDVEHKAVNMSHEEIIETLNNSGFKVQLDTRIVAEETQESSPDYHGYNAISCTKALKL